MAEQAVVEKKEETKEDTTDKEKGTIKASKELYDKRINEMDLSNKSDFVEGDKFGYLCDDGVLIEMEVIRVHSKGGKVFVSLGEHHSHLTENHSTWVDVPSTRICSLEKMSEVQAQFVRIKSTEEAVVKPKTEIANLVGDDADSEAAIVAKEQPKDADDKKVNAPRVAKPPVKVEAVAPVVDDKVDAKVDVKKDELPQVEPAKDEQKKDEPKAPPTEPPKIEAKPVEVEQKKEEIAATEPPKAEAKPVEVEQKKDEPKAPPTEPPKSEAKPAAEPPKVEAEAAAPKEEQKKDEAPPVEAVVVDKKVEAKPEPKEAPEPKKDEAKTGVTAAADDKKEAVVVVDDKEVVVDKDDDDKKTSIPILVTKDFVFKSIDEDNKKIICLDVDFNDVIFDLPVDNNELMKKINKAVEDGKNEKKDVTITVLSAKVDDKKTVSVQNAKLSAK